MMTKAERIAVAEMQLSKWIEASATLAGGKTYEMGTRKLTMVDADYVLSMIKYWKSVLDSLTGGGKRRHFHVVPVDL